MIQTLLNWVGRNFHGGTLIFEAPDGQRWTIGKGTPTARVLLKDKAVMKRILRNPRLAFGETYMEHGWEPEDGNLRHVLEVSMRMLSAADSELGRHRRLRAIRSELSEINEINNPLRSRRNVHQHYDLDYALYSHFLGRDLHYSCAYFKDPDMSLEEAQQAKCAHIAAKLNLKPGARVLDIGCGWGGMSMYLAEHYGAQVVGITLAEEQVKVARARVEERGLDKQVEIRLQDYRKTSGEFDAIVSIGMFEHVGRPQYRTYFNRIRELLTDDGTALVHSIGRTTPPGGTNPWIRKYIFPGGYIPAASEMTSSIETSGLILTDFEVLRVHYARTLNDWAQRFAASREEIAARMGERFCRMWEFYLQASEMNFLWGDLVNFQAQLSKSLKRLPLTRDYLYTPPAQPKKDSVRSNNRSSRTNKQQA